MSKFVPEKTLEVARTVTYPLDIKEEFSETRRMGNIGMTIFYDVLDAALVGWYQPFLPILDRSIEWMRYGISVNEGVGKDYREMPLFTQIGLHEALALALWFRDGIDQPELWRQTLQLHQQMQNECLGEIYGKKDISGLQVNDYMRRCLQAEAYEEGIIGYRHYCGDSIPTGRNLHASERKLGYAYCLHYAEGRYSADELQHAAKILLNRRMDDEWLDRGRPDDALLWLKTVYWNRQADAPNPRQIWMKAYDHLPGVEPLSEEVIQASLASIGEGN